MWYLTNSRRNLLSRTLILGYPYTATDTMTQILSGERKQYKC